MARIDWQLLKRDIAGIALLIYISALLVFVLYPRPILETSNPSQIAEYFRTHANIFYKILYADTHLVGLANFFMLTPFPIILNAFSNTFSLGKIFLICVGISTMFELVQLAIPGRVSDPVDLLANIFSSTLGIFSVKSIRRKKIQK